MMESPRRQGLNAQTERMKLNVKTEERSPHIREEHEVVSTRQRSGRSYKGPVSGFSTVKCPASMTGGGSWQGQEGISKYLPKGTRRFLAPFASASPETAVPGANNNQSREYGKPV